MTSIASTLSVDARGPAALYLISDSRLSWGTGAYWDGGRKTFGCANTPDIFAYCGDALIATTVLGTIVELADSGCLFRHDAGADARHEGFVDAFKVALSANEKNAPVGSFFLLHGSRDGDGMNSKFRLWRLSHRRLLRNWDDTELNFDRDKSVIAVVDGSGGKEVMEEHVKWIDSSASKTSRSTIWAFCDALKRGKDPCSGGAPQMVGLWRIRAAQRFGFFWDGKPYLAGVESSNLRSRDSLRWFNENFERCDGSTGQLVDGAAHQPRPDVACS